MVAIPACAGETELVSPTPTAVSTIVLTLPPTPPITPSPIAATATPAPTPAPRFTVGIETAVPAAFHNTAQAVTHPYPRDFAWVAGDGDVQITLDAGQPLGQWVYAVAAPFATVTDTIAATALQSAWLTGEGAWQVVVDEETAVLFTQLWGTPHTAVQIVPAETLLATLWEKRPFTGSAAGQQPVTLLPFERLSPQLKVLRYADMSPLDADFDAAAYPLTVMVGAVGEETAVAEFLRLWNGPLTNRDPAKLTTVAMTGVTALVRATAFQMELNGILYPGEEVAPILQMADIAHVSNEVAFAPNCPYPDPLGGTSFCSRDSYFALLESVGVDVVELTGNHVNDWGQENLQHTLDLYDAAGWAYFGGGRDTQDAQQAALFTDHGNQIAFVGCNPVGPVYAWATAVHAGSRPCDESFYTQIETLAAQGYVVIATLQYDELYDYRPSAQQRLDFERVAAAGATAVSGSQGHHAQGFAFYGDSFIHYGLGNLFFDQMDQLGTRQTFVDTYVIYEGRLLSVNLWTGLIENYARPRVMTAGEREGALTAVFQASDW
ncbi:MAG: CapA family protein [Ardenticatenaceae bacterium]|nr:CapA family protein [Ardenticatenaceae bacterium]